MNNNYVGKKTNILLCCGNGNVNVNEKTEFLVMKTLTIG